MEIRTIKLKAEGTKLTTIEVPSDIVKGNRNNVIVQLVVDNLGDELGVICVAFYNSNFAIKGYLDNNLSFNIPTNHYLP